MKMTRLLAACLLALPLCAQIQFPGSGGRFPGGGGNSGGRGGNGAGQNTPGRNTPGRKGKEAPPVITTTGILRVVAGNQFVLEADDHRIITYRLGPKPEI